eukprot:jgi/Picsp_1/1507/NSC_04985-R1_trna modification gtpase
MALSTMQNTTTPSRLAVDMLASENLVSARARMGRADRLIKYNYNHSSGRRVSGGSNSNLFIVTTKSRTLCQTSSLQEGGSTEEYGVSDSWNGDDETIVAIVTGGQHGAVSVIRLSGAEAVMVASKVFWPAGVRQAEGQWNPETHRVYYGHAFDSRGVMIDEVLSIVMLGPRSYTADDVVEIHTHGGGICAQRVLQSCLSAGARLAQPGEFTLRAYLNGRMDLSQAESVASLVSARTVAAADSALAGLSGGLGQEIDNVRSVCLALVSEIDAHVDFDEDLPPIDKEAICDTVEGALDRVEKALATAQRGRLLRSGIQVALVGRPNVGKSSLLNSLSGMEKAIVTDIAGTTRDVVEANIVVGGIPVTLLDTAGLRVTEDKVEKIGVERSLAASKSADVVVHVVDAVHGWTLDDTEILMNMFGGNDDQHYMPPMLLVINKSDLAARDIDTVPRDILARFSDSVVTSASSGAGMDTLHDTLLKLVGAPTMTPGGVSWAVNERQSEALTRAYESLVRVQESIEDDLPFDFWTIDLRSAVLALGEVSGAEVTEEVLDDIFSRFCIGK